MVLFSGDFELHTLGGVRDKKQRAFALCPLVNRRRDRQAMLWQFNKGLADVVHTKAKVMKSGSVFCEPCLQRVIRRKRLDKLELSVAQVEVSEADGALVDYFAIEHGQADTVAPYFQRLVRVRHDDRE